jgi:hypothetical protein
MLRGLAARLRPGGLLVLRHANFRFADTRVAGSFRLLFRARMASDAPPIYDRSDRLAPGLRGDDGVYEKRAGSSAA